MESRIRRHKRPPPRSRMDIIANILKETKKPSRKTKIMYSCNLSFRQLKLYLKLLVAEGFLKVIPITESNVVAEAFQTTEEGKSFLRAYDNLTEKFPSSCGR